MSRRGMCTVAHMQHLNHARMQSKRKAADAHLCSLAAVHSIRASDCNLSERLCQLGTLAASLINGRRSPRSIRTLLLINCSDVWPLIQAAKQSQPIDAKQELCKLPSKQNEAMSIEDGSWLRAVGCNSKLTCTICLKGAHWRQLATQALQTWPPVGPSSPRNRQVMHSMQCVALPFGVTDTGAADVMHGRAGLAGQHLILCIGNSTHYLSSPTVRLRLGCMGKPSSARGTTLATKSAHSLLPWRWCANQRPLSSRGTATAKPPLMAASGLPAARARNSVKGVQVKLQVFAQIC